MKHTNFFSLLLLALLALGAAACQSSTPEPPGADSASLPPTATAPTAPAAKLNLNTATGDEFRTIPGVGDRMVHEFEEYRPYASIQQFRREIGKYVDEAQVAAYEQYLFVPIRPADSDAETIRQIPGVDETEAAELIAARPYASRAAFIERAAAYADADTTAWARYVEAL